MITACQNTLVVQTWLKRPTSRPKTEQVKLEESAAKKKVS